MDMDTTFSTAWPYPTEYEPKICVADCNETNDKDSEYMAVLYTSTAVGPYCIPNIFSSNDSAATQMATASASDDSMFGKAMNSGSEVFARAVRDVMETQYLVLIRSFMLSPSPQPSPQTARAQVACLTHATQKSIM